MANFVHYGTVNDLFKKKNERVWFHRNQEKIASPALKKPVKPMSLKVILGVIMLGLFLVGSVAAIVLSQVTQDVRQRASGCVYWNGTPAVEGAFDNRGGIRQQCKGGLWSLPDDGNTDPAEIIAAQQAAQPKDGCVRWDGVNVAHGTYDNRGGIRQQCVDGYWDFPDDRITDPNDTKSIALADAIRSFGTSNFSYDDAKFAYDNYCYGDVEADNTEFCKTLNKGLVEVETRMRKEQVQMLTNQVSYAIGGVDRGTMSYADANAVYNANCQGTALQASESVCSALNERLQEMRRESLAAYSPVPTGIFARVTIDSSPRPTGYYGGSLALSSPRPTGYYGISSYSTPYPTGYFGGTSAYSTPYPSGYIGNLSAYSTPSPSDAGSGYVGPCCVDGTYQSLCRESERDYLPSSVGDCQDNTGDRCRTNAECGPYSKCFISPYGGYCVANERVETGGCGDGVCDDVEDLATCSADCNTTNSRIRCLANTCINGKWCEENGYLNASAVCGEIAACADGTREANCNINSERCLNGGLYFNESCQVQAQVMQRNRERMREALAYVTGAVNNLLPTECRSLNSTQCGNSLVCSWTGGACAPRVGYEETPSCTCSGFGGTGTVGSSLLLTEVVDGQEQLINRTCRWSESRNSCSWTLFRAANEQQNVSVIEITDHVTVFEPETSRNIQRARELEAQYGVELSFVNWITDEDIDMLESTLPTLQTANFLGNQYGDNGNLPLEIVLYNNYTNSGQDRGGITFRGNLGVVYVGGAISETSDDKAVETLIHETAHNNEDEYLEGFVDALAEDGFEVQPYSSVPVQSNFCYSSTDVESWACGVTEYFINRESFCAGHINTCAYLENEVFND